MSKLKRIISKLDELHGEVTPFLNHDSAFQLLIAVILSAQTTDAMVNKVTADLFSKYPDAKSLALADISTVENLIRRVNYHKTKAKNIIKTASMIVNDFDDEVPKNISDLIKLAGVGRKVANVIMADLFRIPAGVVVDTHVKRVSFRLGWTNHKSPEKIELDLMKLLPKSKYVNFPKQLILIGRQYCLARNPDCANCPLESWCEKRI